jgi:hypothetical protein
MAFAARFVFALAIIVAHPFGGMFYFTLLIALAVGSRFEGFLSRRTLAHAVARAANRGWPVVLALAVIVIFGPKLPGSDEQGVIWQVWSLSSLAKVFAAYFRSYNIIYDALVGVLFVLIVGAAALRGRLRYHAGLLAVSLMLGLVTPFVPMVAMGTNPLNARLPMMMVLAMAAGLRPELEVSVAASRFAVGAALALVLLRTAYITTVWRGAERDLAAVRSAVASVEPGSAVLPVQYEISPADRPLVPTGRLLGGKAPNYWHYPSLVVVDRKAFIPWLFSTPGKQPLRVLPPWSEISTDEGLPQPVSALMTINAGRYAFMNDWHSRFDYVLLLNADLKSRI